MLTRTDLEELLDGGEDSLDDPAYDQPDLTVGQLAGRFERSEQAIRDWIREGKLTAYKFNGREYRVTWDSLIEFEQRQRNGNQDRTTVEPPPLSKWREG